MIWKGQHMRKIPGSLSKKGVGREIKQEFSELTAAKTVERLHLSEILYLHIGFILNAEWSVTK